MGKPQVTSGMESSSESPRCPLKGLLERDIGHIRAILGYIGRFLGLDIVQGISNGPLVWALTFFKGI